MKAIRTPIILINSVVALLLVAMLGSSSFNFAVGLGDGQVKYLEFYDQGSEEPSEKEKTGEESDDKIRTDLYSQDFSLIGALNVWPPSSSNTTPLHHPEILYPPPESQECIIRLLV